MEPNLVLSRSFLTRLLLAVLGMLLIGIAGVGVLGWLVFESTHSRQVWFRDVLGEDRWSRLYFFYARNSGALFPTDSDGDGFPDLLERYMGVLPDDPTMYPNTTFVFDGTGFTATDFEKYGTGLSILLQPGERRRIRGQVRLDKDATQPAWFAKGVQWSLKPNQDGLPSPPESLVSMARDGRMEFDVMVPSDAKNSGPSFQSLPYLVAWNPITGEPAAYINFRVGTRKPPLPCTVEEVPVDNVPDDIGNKDFARGKHLVRVSWPRERERPSGPFYIEATRDESGKEWFVATTCPPEIFSVYVVYEMWDDSSRHHGPIKFRVIPTE